jgi:hypothetical protein
LPAKDPKGRDSIAQISNRSEEGQRVLNVGHVEKFEATELHKRNTSPGQFDSSGVLCDGFTVSLASPPQADWRRCVGVAAVFATNRTSSLASATKVALQRPTSHRNEERSQVPRAQNQDAPTKRQFAMWKGGQTAKTCIGCLAAASVPRRRPARRQFCLR